MTDEVSLTVSQPTVLRGPPKPVDVRIEAVVGRERLAYSLEDQPFGELAGRLCHRALGSCSDRQSHLRGLG